jgi:hypothetical protein
MSIEIQGEQTRTTELPLERSADYPELSEVMAISPDGEWLAALLLKQPSQSSRHWLLRLYSLRLGTIVDVAEGFYIPSRTTRWSPQLLAWSPDSSKLAFQATQKPTIESIHASIQTLFIYDLSQATLATLLTASAVEVRFDWTADSNMLAVARQFCNSDLPNPQCDVELILFKLAEMSKPNKVNNFASQGLFADHDVLSFCNFSVSPTGAFAAFVSRCRYDGTTPHEVFVWDTQQNTISQLTDFTTHRLSENPNVATYYSTFWGGSETLLISALTIENYATPSEIRTGNTLEAHIPSNTQKKVFDIAISEWSVNPITYDLAYVVRANTIGESVISPMPSHVNLLQAENAQLTINSELINASEVLPKGCLLQWSPDGEWLAYQTPSAVASQCTALLAEQFIFYNATTKQLLQFELPEIDDRMLSQAVGWVLK